MGNRLQVGVVGAGAIGTVISRALTDGSIAAELAGVCEVNPAAREALTSALGVAPRFLPLDELAAAADVIVEATAKSVAPTVIETALRAGADVVVLSVSALLEREDLVALAAAQGRRILVPTGAIAGLDALRAAAVAGVEEVTLTTTKPPAGLSGAPGVVASGIDLATLTAPTVLFEGSAREATAAFPANVNVAAALALAGIGAARTRVRVVCDPTSSRNRHEIQIRGAAGEVQVTVDNVPSPANPKTSYLAALSAIALLQRLTAPLVVGS
ncbi:MAG: aspartate dehydrogenase [Fimbriimonadaceae bacterium]|nr:aspartate dehydrogenase [Fimbriimonadaceae bacterium]